MEPWKKNLKNGFILKSSRYNKKLMTIYEGKVIHFGDKKYEHFRDKTGLYRHLDHNDNERRNKYISRHSKVKNKDDEYVINDPKSPSYWSLNILW